MIQRKLSDYKGGYLNSDIHNDPVIYEFNNTTEEDNDAHLLYGLTNIKPGDINGEYYMTKGHKHIIPSAEIYCGISGYGIVLQENNDDIIVTPITSGVSVYCKPNYAHRLINIGDRELQVFCICRADAGHDYSYKFRTRFIKGENLNGAIL